MKKATLGMTAILLAISVTAAVQAAPINARKLGKPDAACTVAQVLTGMITSGR